jgi:replicative DNA helicase
MDVTDRKPRSREDSNGESASELNRRRSASGRPLADLDQFLERQLPHSIEAERAVIGSLLMLPEACDEVALIIRHDDFYDDVHQRIYRHILALHELHGNFDPMLVLQRLRDAGEDEIVGGSAYLLEICQEVSTAAHAEYYARVIHEKSMLRSLIHAGTDIVRDAYKPNVDTRETLNNAEERVFSILDEKSESQLSSIREVLHKSMERIDARSRNESFGGGIETGFRELDEMTGGLHPSELIILAARPSMGKTALALNIVEHVAFELREPVLLISLEMAAIEIGDRLLCSRARVDGHRVRSGYLNTEASHKLIATASEMNSAPLFIEDAPNRNMMEIAATARRLKRKEGLKLIVIDYLQLIDADNQRDARHEQISKISRRLKGLAREMNVPVLCLAQLNRQVEDTRDKKPQLSHLRESGSIEQDADIVMFIHRDEYYSNDDEEKEAVKGKADLMIKKQRNGRTGDIKLAWLHNFTRFQDLAPDRYEEFDSGQFDDGFGPGQF